MKFLSRAVLVMLMVDARLERDSLEIAVEDDQASLAGAATAPCADEASRRRTRGTRGDGELVQCRSMALDGYRDRAL
jgi:hypothetical protein